MAHPAPSCKSAPECRNFDLHLPEPQRPSDSQSTLKVPEPTLQKPLAPSISSATSFDSFIREKVDVVPLPPIHTNLTYASWRYCIVTVYRRLFSIVFVANLIVLGVILWRHRTTKALLQASAANLVVCGLARLPFVVNTLYLLVCAIPRSAPLPLRRMMAKVSHYGGIHSGCGVATCFWYMAYVALLSYDYATYSPPERPSIAVVVLSYLVLLLLIGMIVAAYPVLRFIKHDWFEFTHRFSAWMLVALFWPTYIVAAHDASKLTHTGLGRTLIQDPTFWFAVVLTCSLITPWVTLRRVPVSPEHLSNHAIRLHFDFTTTKFAQGVGVSTHPLRDWHAFAGIPDESSHGFSVVVSKAGDWTAACIKNKPTKLWKRAVPAYGFGRAISLFHSALVICTGSGIGPCLSLISSNKRPPVRVLWQTRNPRKTYGDRILSEVAQLDPKAVVIDTDEHGRQDMMELAWSMVKQGNLESVFVISRPDVVKSLVFGFEARGVPAYGPIFDS